MSSFIAIVFATLKEEGIETEGLSVGEAVKKFKELQSIDFVSKGIGNGEKPHGGNRIKIAEVRNPIYNYLTLTNGKKISDIISSDIEVPTDTKSIGIKHIGGKEARKDMFDKYREDIPTIVNEPDFIFEDKKKSDTVLIARKIERNVVLVIGLNYNEKNHTNSLLTMWDEPNDDFKGTIKSYEKIGKVLYKRE